MKVKWYAHSAFKLTTIAGIEIVIDPYKPGGLGGAINYVPIEDRADIVLISHNHEDHNYVKGIHGDFNIIRRPGTYREKGIVIRTMETRHGSGLGRNLVFLICADGMRTIHLGDIGPIPGKEIVKMAGGSIDIIMMPIDGVYTLRPREAARIVGDVRPAFVFPMHFRTENACRNLGGVEEFAKHTKDLRRLSDSEIELKADTGAQEPRVFLLRQEKGVLL